MTDDVFDDSMKRIFGRGTSPRDGGRSDADAAARQVLDEDLQRRERLVDRFRSTVLSKTEAMCGRIAPIAQEAGFKVIQVASNIPVNGSIAQIAYSISRDRNPGLRIVPLHVALMLSGVVFVGNPPAVADPSLMPVSFVTVLLDMRQADLPERLKQAFQDYFEKAVTMLHRQN